MLFYVGCYTKNDSVLTSAQGSGIVVCDLNEKTGSIVERFPAVKIDNPSWLIVSSDRKYLYVVSELFTVTFCDSVMIFL